MLDSREDEYGYATCACASYERAYYAHLNYYALLCCASLGGLALRHNFRVMSAGNELAMFVMRKAGSAGRELSRPTPSWGAFRKQTELTTSGLLCASCIQGGG